ncbi:hypothetical protein CFC21_016907 [Triticum aestivum]|uniref:Pentacotripeptide-repeat region of PRORP domain-containing protein n=2 Tax=Triticum aestivum TaxID=4565 RepID=A0A3B6AX56_WHEAT|nr:putative pentatricopeptide repeat-containing protein At1g74580 [Triticum aestivum]KAF7001189.1 hypothetical protein CFC21_016907 [Triticum aestivum]
MQQQHQKFRRAVSAVACARANSISANARRSRRFDGPGVRRSDPPPRLHRPRRCRPRRPRLRALGPRPASLHPLYVASIRAFARAGRLQAAVDAFERMDLFACPPQATAYNAIMDALVHAHHHHHQAHKVYVRMLATGLAPDLHTHTIRLRSFCLTARPHVALRLLRTLPDRGCHARPVAYCTVVSGLYAHGHPHDARRLFDEMLQGPVFLDTATFNKVLHDLCKKGDISEAAALLAKVLKRGMSVNRFTYNIWIRGLCECGRLAQAVALVKEMDDYITPDVVTYNTLIRGL